MSADQQLALARSTRGGESSHLSRAAQKVVPPFLQKLYEIVNDPKNDELIRWSDSGDSFYVLNHERFAREVLGRWFKHQKFTSFVRQLNMYGFHKVPHLQQGVLKSETDTEPWHFEHPHFHRGQPDLLCLIQRKKQPTHAGAEDVQMDGVHDHTGSPATPTANLTAGQLLDINSIMNGISAIKRHQQAISADLNELKSSNQHLWQEALAARERHKKHQDTINRILKFLAGVFGNAADSVKHDGSNDGTNGIRRQRQRLLIGDANRPEKKKSIVEEVDDDDDRRSVRSDQAPSTPTPRFITIDTPEPSVHSPGPQSPGMTPNDNYGPSITDISSTYRPTVPPPVRPAETLSRAPSEAAKSVPATPAPASLPNLAQSPLVDGTLSPAALTVGAQNMPGGDWSAALRTMFSSPSAMQQLMQAFAAQQNHPVMPPSTPKPEDIPDPRLATHQLTPYDPAAYDFSRLRTDLPPPPPTAATESAASTLAPSLLGPLIPKEDGPALEPLMESANRLQKTYHDASEIDADVDALQFSLNSLIHNLGLDPSSVAQQTPHEGNMTPSHDVDTGGGTGGAADFDFDAFLNELSSRSPADNGSFPDLSHFDGAGPRLDGTQDPSTDQLTAFLDDVSDNTSLRNEQYELPTSAGRKRKSDVADLPPPIVSDGSSIALPKVKRKR